MAEIAIQDTITAQGPRTAVTTPVARKTAPDRRPPSSAGGAVYAFGMIGALAYFLGTARTGQDRVLAVGKAVIWPALLVYLAFKRLAA